MLLFGGFAVVAFIFGSLFYGELARPWAWSFAALRPEGQCEQGLWLMAFVGVLRFRKKRGIDSPCR